MSVNIKSGNSTSLANVDANGNLNVTLENAVPQSDRTASLSFESIETLEISLQGSGTIRVSILGTWTGNLFFETTIDGLNWLPFGLIPFSETVSGAPVPPLPQTVVQSAVGNGTWLGSAGGLQSFRVRGAVTSGSANVFEQAGTAVSVVNAFINVDGFVDENNSSQIPLAANGVFTGLPTDMLAFTSVRVALSADQNSAINGFQLQWSEDGVNWDFGHSITYIVASDFHPTFTRVARYFRLIYTNGSSPQTFLRLTSVMQRITVDQIVNFINAPVQDYHTAQTSKVIIHGKNPSGNYIQVPVDVNGALLVNSSEVTQPVSISGTIPVSGTIGVNNFPAIQPISGTVNVGNLPSTQPVSGTVAVSNFPVTQPISGTLDVSDRAARLVGHVNVDNLPATQPVSIASMPSTPVTGTFWQTTQPVSIASMPSTPVTGTFWQTTQPVSGTVGISNFPATQPISAVSLPLPSNAAQETGGNLATVATQITTNTTNQINGTSKTQVVDPSTFTGANVSAKGIQGSNFLAVQDAKDSGRSKVILTLTKTTSITTEALVTLTQKKGDATTTTGTSYTVTSGKTLHIQSMLLSATLTTAGITAVAARLREGAASGGAVSVTSDIISELEVSCNIAAIGVSGQSTITFPDGLEITGGQNIGISELATTTDLAVTIVIVGFEY